jgi:hypothetical protein
LDMDAEDAWGGCRRDRNPWVEDEPEFVRALGNEAFLF